MQIMSDEEKQKIDETHKDAYGYALRYGSDPTKKNWYICPRFWCMKTNMPLTEEEVNAGVCADNMHEFTSKTHQNAKGEYVQHNPGFLPKDAHPTSCLPCCFKKAWGQQQLQNRRDQCNIKPQDVSGPSSNTQSERETTHQPESEALVQENPNNPKREKKTKLIDENPKFYIMSFDTFPIRKNRWGFLPPSMQLFLQIDYSTAITKRNAALIKPNMSVFLRYGIEQSLHQSFIGAIADIFGSVNRYKEQQKPIPTIQEMRALMIDAVTLDTYLKYHNGSLVSVFQPKKVHIEPKVLNKYMQSVCYQSLNKSDDAQMDFFEDTVASFENFLDYLRDDDSWIDHTYLWDMVTMPNSKLFPGGLNLVIINVADNDITDNVELICPSNSYADDLYDPRKETVLLMKHNEYY